MLQAAQRSRLARPAVSSASTAARCSTPLSGSWTTMQRQVHELVAGSW